MSVIPQPTDSDALPYSVYEYYFSAETPGLAVGNPVPIVNLDPGQILMDAFIVVTTAFNGTTPKADIGFSESGGTRLFDTFDTATAPVNLGTVGTAFGPSTEIAGATSSAPATTPATAPGKLVLNPLPPMNYATGQQPAGPSRELSLLVNSTGVAGGAAANPTVGAAKLYLVVATPININPTDPPIPSLS